jgi:single-stranded-DNA-specific exonuclease
MGRMALAEGRWSIAPCAPPAVAELERALGLRRPTAEVLVRRGLADPASARAFLDAGELRHDPFALGDMTAACERIERAIAAGERICVHGDYDVDGICATALAVSTLRRHGADVAWHLPSRFEEGYGLAVETLDRLAADGMALVVTVDCGITAVEPVSRARALGVDVIITDHHRPGDELPDCPRVCTRPSEYPFRELCGTGVAYKLAQALDARAGRDGEAEGDLDLVALATVADVVPLVDENRALVRAGLRRLARTERAGLRALMASASVDRTRVRSGDVGFRLAPRINAAGRLCHPGDALELLLTADEDRARELAGRLEDLNRERQVVEDRILREAVEEVEANSDGWRDRRAYVLSSPDWHEGVIGIVASRLVERYCRPVVLIAERGDESKGSGRSIPAYDLHAGLSAAREHLARFGGHRAAAGLTMAADRIDALALALARHAGDALTDADLRPSHRIDAVVAPGEISLELADELATLEPFGLGNPTPTLLAPAARLGDVERMGEGRHLRASVELGGFRCRAVAFGHGAAVDRLRGEARFDVAYTLQRNEWNGAVAPQMHLRAAVAAPVDEPPLPGACRSACDATCTLRAGGGAVLAAAVEPLPPGGGAVHDRRNAGAQIATVARLLAGGERVLLVVADVARRRAMLRGALHPGRFGARAAYLFSRRCAPEALRRRLEEVGEEPALALADYDALAALPGLLRRFPQVVALDPPPDGGRASLLEAPPDGVDVHLVWGRAEVEFARSVAKEQAPLRPALATVWRARRDGAPAALEALPPETVARCVAVLAEVGLDDPAAAPAERVDLAASSTYRESEARLARALAYLATV